ncbi:MAG TPA: hypothetical protein VFQ61_12065 [Polyangiaceae bacterium]|nr:hypothetical protein [Polyangiaceae bacterium]
MLNVADELSRVRRVSVSDWRHSRRARHLLAACSFLAACAARLTAARADWLVPDQARSSDARAAQPASRDVRTSKPGTTTILYADLDDDDDDGLADAQQPQLRASQHGDLLWLRAPQSNARFPILTDRVRVVVGSQPLPLGARVPATTRLGLQGVAAGHVPSEAVGGFGDLSVIEFLAMDMHGSRVDLARSHASLSRVLPDFLATEPSPAAEAMTRVGLDEDALRWVAIGESTQLPEQVDIVSLAADGHGLDELRRVELWAMPCPSHVAPELACRGTALIRAVVDRIDRNHPESARRSLRAEVGGRVQVRVGERKVSSIRVGGPRSTAVGPIGRYRAKLAVHLFREALDGPPALPGSDAQALERARAEVQAASLLWGQCGIHFGLERDLMVELLNPPVPYLLSLGSLLGIPASGGELHFRVGARRVHVSTRAGQTPLEVATRVVAALSRLGLRPELSRNPRVEPGALETADVLVFESADTSSQLRRHPVRIEPDGQLALNTDPSLSVQIGSVDFADGLSHFDDYDSAAGTLEERTLLKANLDDDPASIDVFIVPTFSGYGRVGESFLDGLRSTVQNAVIIDRSAVLSGIQSHVLAHEIGHILLNMPGHPDDYGVDQPSALMDADATDPSIFGPRRLSIAECERVLRERGPSAPAPLLQEWPLFAPPRR